MGILGGIVLVCWVFSLWMEGQDVVRDYEQLGRDEKDGVVLVLRLDSMYDS